MELDKALMQLFYDIDLFNEVTLIYDLDERIQKIVAWNRPELQPTPEELEVAWQAWLSGQSARDARELEVNEAQPVAKQWFDDHPAAVAFVRLTSVQRESQIDSMTLAQLREVIKFMAEAITFLIKRELSD